MISRIKIKNLFEQFNYTINFNNTGITIITGPNGFGKSTILRIIETFIDKTLYDLSQFSFSELEITLIQGDTILISKTQDYITINNCSLNLFNKRIISNWQRRHGLPFIERIGPDTYIDMRFDKVISLEEYKSIMKQETPDKKFSDILIEINYEQARRDKKEVSRFKVLDKELSDFRTKIGKIKFIKEQRLLRQETIEEDNYYSREKKSTTIEVINEIPNKIKEEIRAAVLKYSEISSNLDSSYPTRLFESKQTITQKEFLEEFANIIEKQEKIKDYSLIKDLSIKAPKEFNDEYSKALKVYLQDTITKLSVFDEIIKKIDLFVNIINKKLNFKKISISNDDGIKIVRKNNEQLELNKLSSGEQQIIVLYYDLIFGIQDKVILMIDEPEISLHVAWQRELMNDFNQIIKLKKDTLKVIIATHSPQVINNHWNNIIDLGELYGE